MLAATWFGAGLMPRMPGTWGSAAALPFAWVISTAGGWPALALATGLVSLLGWWAAEVYVRGASVDDPSAVVIDEVAGQWLVLIACPPDPLLYALGFLIFRVLDIFKPWPASWADRYVKGGLGVMLDDLLAAVYGVPLMAAAVWWWGR
jgi:phosphatidylglycerophosphatase A